MYEHRPPAEQPSVTVQCTITVHPVSATDYDQNGPDGNENVPAGPVAEFLAAMISNDSDRAEVAKRAIVDDERYGPVHLVRLVAAVDHAVRQVNRTAAPVIGDGRLVTALRRHGLHAATDVAKTMSADDRIAILHHVMAYPVACAFLDQATTSEPWWPPTGD